MKDNQYIFMIVLQSILYGSMDIISKQVYDRMPVYCFLFLRYVLATILMLLIWNNTILQELKSVPITRYLVPAVCMSCAFIFSNMALKFTAATNVSFIRSLSAILAPLLLVIFYKHQYRKHDVVLQIMMVIGLYLLCAKGGLHRFGIGEVLSFIAALLVAGSLVFGKTSLDYIGAKTLSFVQTVFAIFVCGIMSVCTGSMSYMAAGVDGTIIAALIYAATACTIGGYMLQNVALQHISSKAVGIVQSIYPIATAIMAYFILNEKLSMMGIIGAFIIGGCVVAENMMGGDK